MSEDGDFVSLGDGKSGFSWIWCHVERVELKLRLVFNFRDELLVRKKVREGRKSRPFILLENLIESHPNRSFCAMETGQLVSLMSSDISRKLQKSKNSRDRIL